MTSISVRHTEDLVRPTELFRPPQQQHHLRYLPADIEMLAYSLTMAQYTHICLHSVMHGHTPLIILYDIVLHAMT